MQLIKNFKIGKRIGVLVSVLLLFVAIIGGIGIYKMFLIGEKLEDISKQDMPMTVLLTKITEHQLEQEILFEKMLRLKGVTSRAKGETFETIAEKFKKKAHLVEEELVEAEKMSEEFIHMAHNEKSKKEFLHILEELKKIEAAHKQYDDHAIDVIKKLQTSASYAENRTKEFDKLVVKTEHEGEEVGHEVELILEEIEKFTSNAINEALIDEKRGVTLISTLSILILFIGIVLGIFLARSVVMPVKNMTVAMNELAEENLDIEIPESKYNDEVRDMASAMQVFRNNMQRARDLEEKQHKIKAKQQQRQNELNQLVGIFGSTIGAVFENILHSSGQMVNKSTIMKEKSGSTQLMATNASDEASQTSNSTHTLSAAAEEMSATIKEISQRVNQTTNVVNEAVASADSSQADFERLVKTSQEMADLLKNISDVSEQINLLALNATIESARAGEAGKGFAVVASEVKNLASQTNTLTDEINNMIDDMQSACQNSSDSIDNISKSVKDVNQYISSIDSSIKEQSVATNEISSIAASVSQNSEHVSKNIEDIKTQSSEVEASSNEVNSFASVMKKEAEVLSKEIVTFLNAMQGTDIEDDTYEAQNISIDATVDLNTKGSWTGKAKELSCAHIVVSPAIDLKPAESLEITLEGLPTLNARIAKHEGDNSYLQLPLDMDHLTQMKEHIMKLTNLRQAA